MSAIQANALASLAVAALVVTGCRQQDDQVIGKADSLVERFADHQILTAGYVADAKLTFTGSGGGPTISRELKGFNLPQATLLLLPPASRGNTLGNLGDAGALQPLGPPCARKSEYYNETLTLVIDVCVPVVDELAPPDLFGSESAPTPEHEILYSSSPDSLLYLCYTATIEVTGMIVCQNYCNSAAITCDFIGPGINIEVDAPDRDADRVTITACNTMNDCVGPE